MTVSVQKLQFPTVFSLFCSMVSFTVPPNGVLFRNRNLLQTNQAGSVLQKKKDFSIYLEQNNTAFIFLFLTNAMIGNICPSHTHAKAARKQEG